MGSLKAWLWTNEYSKSRHTICDDAERARSKQARGLQPSALLSRCVDFLPRDRRHHHDAPAIGSRIAISRATASRLCVTKPGSQYRREMASNTNASAKIELRRQRPQAPSRPAAESRRSRASRRARAGNRERRTPEPGARASPCEHAQPNQHRKAEAVRLHVVPAPEKVEVGQTRGRSAQMPRNRRSSALVHEGEPRRWYPSQLGDPEPAQPEPPRGRDRWAYGIPSPYGKSAGRSNDRPSASAICPKMRRKSTISASDWK